MEMAVVAVPIGNSENSRLLVDELRAATPPRCADSVLAVPLA
jgi:hypothetical protein